MGTRTATRSQMLVALRRWMPNASIRRIGDLLDQAKVISVEAKSEYSTSIAFGMVLDGTLRISMEGSEPRWIGPGEVFGMAQYELNRFDSAVRLEGTTKPVRYLAFSHADIASLDPARQRSPEK